LEGVTVGVFVGTGETVLEVGDGVAVGVGYKGEDGVI
jgi:hypothetical protein